MSRAVLPRRVHWLAGLAFALLGCAGVEGERRGPDRPAGGAAVGTSRLSALLGTTVTLRGLASDAKAGAVLVRGSEVVYIDGLDAWPVDVVDRRVAVIGHLERRKYIPDPGPAGARTQGAEGEQYVLEHAHWVLR